MYSKKSIFRIFSFLLVAGLLLALARPTYAGPSSLYESGIAVTQPILQFTVDKIVLGSNEMFALPNEVVATGITDIQSFLTKCPNNDPAYNQIRQDFELRLDGVVITYLIPCTEPIATIPIDQFTDELIALQTLRTAYYMGMGTEGKLPWTSKDLYSWMKSNIAGINIKTVPLGGNTTAYCCDSFNGKKYFVYSRQDAINREFRRDWTGISGLLGLYAHEIRHADPGAPGHTTGCPRAPLPADSLSCDATYDLNNLGSYGVQYWLASNWATGYLNIGIGCAPPGTALEYTNSNVAWANVQTPSGFVTNAPPTITATSPYGGICTIFSDVSSTYWAVSYVEQLHQAGITGGCSAIPLSYCPEASVTRAQMAVFLEKGKAYPSSFSPPNVPPTFTDTVGHWAEDWIEALKSDGITSGCGNGNYCPDSPVTRAQMAVFLLKAKHGTSFTPPNATGVFTDVPVGYWADKWIEQLAVEGITSGCGTGIYCPDSPVTRAQMAVFLVKTFGLP